MTTPRDDIADLSERLREIADHDWRVSFLAHTSDTATEAATQLDALSARVKELEYYKNTAVNHLKTVWPEDQDISGVKSIFGLIGWMVKERERATRAEQERDEAYERLKPFAKAGELFQTPGDYDPGDYDQCIYAPAAGQQYNLTADHLRAAHDLIRRLASGPEKEKRE